MRNHVLASRSDLRTLEDRDKFQNSNLGAGVAYTVTINGAHPPGAPRAPVPASHGGATARRRRRRGPVPGRPARAADLAAVRDPCGDRQATNAGRPDRRVFYPYHTRHPSSRASPGPATRVWTPRL